MTMEMDDVIKHMSNFMRNKFDPVEAVMAENLGFKHQTQYTDRKLHCESKNLQNRNPCQS